MRLDWDAYFMQSTKIIASRSTCLSRKVGAIIVKNKQILSVGYNGSISGDKHCNELGYCNKRKNSKSQECDCRAIHAEINAITCASKNGISTNDSTMYITISPCNSCFKAIMASGIKEIVIGGAYKKEQNFYNKQNILTIRYYKDKREDQLELMRNITRKFEQKDL